MSGTAGTNSDDSLLINAIISGITYATGQSSADLLEGSDGSDALSGGQGEDTLDGGAGNDTLQGGQGTDTLLGGSGNDILDGGQAGDVLEGGEGEDVLLGGQGNDGLSGGAGDDTIQGSQGNDVLSGGEGDDYLSGGQGADTFTASTSNGSDTLADFDASSGDTIDLSAAGFTAAEFDSAVTQVGSNTVIDLGGGNQITLLGVTAAELTADAFVFAPTAGPDQYYITASEGGPTYVIDDVFQAWASNVASVTESSSVWQSEAVDGSDTISVMVTGSGLAYANGLPSAGVVIGLEVRVNGVLLLTAETPSVPAADLATFVTEVLNGTPDSAAASQFWTHDSVHFTGSAYADAWAGYEFDDVLVGNAGNDLLTGNGGSDQLSGGAGHDTLIGGDGDDELYGGDNQDWMEGGAGTDLYDGGGGRPDTVSFASETGINGAVVDLGAGLGSDTWGNAETIVGVEQLIGSFNSDLLTGDPSGYIQQRFAGLAGADIIDGGGQTRAFAMYHYDAMYGGLFGVSVNLAEGWATDGFGDTDTLTNIFRVTGTDQDDTFIGNESQNQFFGLNGADTYDGYNGSRENIVSYATETGSFGAVVNFTTGYGTDTWGNIETYIGIEYAIGSKNDDTLIGDAGPNRFFGSDGADYYDGAGGDHNRVDYNEEQGGLGVVASLEVGSGTDTWGNLDTYVDIDELVGSDNNDQLDGDAGANWLDGILGDDVLVGLDGDDTLLGSEGNDVLLGGTGYDQLFGGVGDDRVDGGADNDVIFGGSGDDQLYGGAGDDELNGESGADLFVFTDNVGTDQITDFNYLDGDRIDLSYFGLVFDDLVFRLEGEESTTVEGPTTVISVADAEIWLLGLDYLNPGFDLRDAFWV